MMARNGSSLGRIKGRVVLVVWNHVGVTCPAAYESEDVVHDMSQLYGRRSGVLWHPVAKITIPCSYQACDEESCGLPATIEAALTVPLEELVETEGARLMPNALNKNRLQSAESGNQNDKHSTYD